MTADSGQQPTSAPVIDPAPSPNGALGVLFVHGMGEQKKGDTLIGLGEPILRFLNNWYHFATGHDPITCATAMRSTQIIRIDDPDRDAPAHTTVTFNVRNSANDGFPTDGNVMLFAESWWAEDFRQASFLDVLKWGLFSAPFALADTIFYQRTRKSLWFNLQLPLTWLFAPVIQFLLVVMFPIALLPLFRNFTGAFMLRIGNVLGDPYLLLSSQMRLSSMVERIHHDIRWLRKRGCRQLVVIAHSQGSAIAHYALRSWEQEPNLEIDVRRLVTFGSPIRKLGLLLRLLESGGNSRIRALLASLSSLVMIVAFGLVWLRIDHWLQFLIAFGLVWLVFASIHGALTGTFDTLLRGPNPVDFELTPSNVRISNDETGRVQWDNYYSRADPFASGELDPTLNDPPIMNHEVRNRDSIFFDHSSYPRNPEQFLGPVCKSLLMDAGWQLSPADDARWAEQVGDPQRGAYASRTDRVEWLNKSVWAALAGMTIGVAWLGGNGVRDLGQEVASWFRRIAEEIKIPFEGGLQRLFDEQDVVYPVLGLVAIILTVMLWFGVVVKWRWEAWNSTQTSRMFRNAPTGQASDGGRAGSVPFFVVVGIGIVLFPILLTIVNPLLRAIWP